MIMSDTGPGDLQTHRDHFWDAAAQGRLLIKRCRDCQEHFFYPRPFCPFCASADTEWVAASGRGVVHSYSLMRRKGEVVFAPAFVTLEEGPTIPTALIDAGAGVVAIGQPVEVVFAPTEAHPSTPFFRPRD